jgi:hypothetical protein
VPDKTNKERSWLEPLRDALGALAGVAAIVYITGGFIIGLRLGSAKLPTASVVGQLPRDLLISVGLSQGLFPALFLGAVHAGFRSAIYRDDAPQRLKGMYFDKSRGGRVRHILWTFGATAIVLAPAVIASVLRNGSALHQHSTFFWVSLAIIALLTWLGMLLYLNLRARVARGYSPNHFKSVGATLLQSLLVAAAVVPGCVAFWGSWPLEEAKVCMTRTGTERPASPSGYLVGETKERVYIGDSSGAHRRITSVPSAQVRRVVLGPAAIGEADCS